MPKYIDVESEAMDESTLDCWYCASVDDSPPIWTPEHIEELCRDFYVIPNDVCAADVRPERYGNWVIEERGKPRNGSTYIVKICSVCEFTQHILAEWNYCPNCGAKMLGKDNGNEQT